MNMDDTKSTGSNESDEFLMVEREDANEFEEGDVGRIQGGDLEHEIQEETNALGDVQHLNLQDDERIIFNVSTDAEGNDTEQERNGMEPIQEPVEANEEVPDIQEDDNISEAEKSNITDESKSMPNTEDFNGFKSEFNHADHDFPLMEDVVFGLVNETLSSLANMCEKHAKTARDFVNKVNMEATKNSQQNAFWAQLQQPHIVRALQEAINSPAITNAVVNFAKKHTATIESAKESFLMFLGDLLIVLGDLLNKAPELLATVSQIIGFLIGKLSEAVPTETQDNSTTTACAPEIPVPAPLPTCPIVHPHILCDGCTTSEKKAKSIANGTIIGDHIAGIRWKSATIQNFDLCGTCEASGAFEEEYGPFLKITDPKKAPREIIVVLRNRSRHVISSSSHGSTAVPLCAPEDVRSRYRPCGSTETSKLNQEDALEIRCPQDHILTNFCDVMNRFRCDSCSIPGSKKAMFYGCRQCDFDLCQNCAEKRVAQSNDDRAHAGAKVTPSNNLSEPELPREVEHTASKEPQIAAPLRAKFVADVSLPDGSLVAPSSRISKVWKVQNNGLEDWPSGVMLVCVGGDRMGGPISGKVMPPIAKNGTADIRLDLVAPLTPGRTIGYWRLMSPAPDSKRFGHRLWVDITVSEPVPEPPREEQRPVPPPPPPVATPVATPVEPTEEVNEAPTGERVEPTEESPYQAWMDEISRMVDMGFFDIETNLKLLQAKGSLEEAVNSILNPNEQGGNEQP